MPRFGARDRTNPEGQVRLDRPKRLPKSSEGGQNPPKIMQKRDLAELSKPTMGASMSGTHSISSIWDRFWASKTPLAFQVGSKSGSNRAPPGVQMWIVVKAFWSKSFIFHDFEGFGEEMARFGARGRSNPQGQVRLDRPKRVPKSSVEIKIHKKS